MKTRGPLGYVVTPTDDGRYRVKVINDDRSYEFNVPNRAAAFKVMETMGMVANEVKR